MLLPDSIVDLLDILNGEQIREIVHAIRAYQGGEEVSAESLSPAISAIFKMAVTEIDTDRKKADISEKRRQAAAKSHEKRRENNCKKLQNQLQNPCKPLAKSDFANAKPVAKDDFANVCKQDDITSKVISNNANTSHSASNNNISSNQESANISSPSLFPSSSLTLSPEEKFLASIDRQEFVPILREWFAYKREKKQTYKPVGMKKCYKELTELSGGDPAKAQEVVDFSIARNYAGLFAPKDMHPSVAAQRPSTYIPYDNEEAKKKYAKFENPYADD